MSETNCIQPGTVALADLVAYVEGEAWPDLVAHVQRCSVCRAEARQLARLNERLRQTLYRADCPSPQMLGEYALNFCPPTEHREIAAHVLDCPRCADELRTLREFLAGDVLDAEPTPSLAHQLRKLVASLVPQSPGPALAGLRGTTNRLSQQYRADGISITVEWRPGPRPGLGALVGLVLADDDADVARCSVRLIRLDERHTTQTLEEQTDELGNFLFEGLPPGAYRLEVDLADATVVAALRWDG